MKTTTAASTGKFKQTVRVFFSRGIIVKICFGIIVLFILAAIFAPVLTPYAPEEQALHPQQPLRHDILGADQHQPAHPVRVVRRIVQGQDSAQGQPAQVHGGGQVRAEGGECLIQAVIAGLAALEELRQAGAERGRGGGPGGQDGVPAGGGLPQAVEEDRVHGVVPRMSVESSVRKMAETRMRHYIIRQKR